MDTVEVFDGHPLRGRVNAETAIRPIGPRVNGSGQMINAAEKPHPTARWISSALLEETKPGGTIDDYHWEAWSFDVASNAYVRVAGGAYFVHEVGEEPDIWLEGSKQDTISWLLERGYVNPAELAKAPKVQRVTTPPVSAPPVQSDELAGSVSRHPSGGISAAAARAELQRRKDKRKAIAAGMSKAEAALKFPAASDELFHAKGPELKAVAA